MHDNSSSVAPLRMGLIGCGQVAGYGQPPAIAATQQVKQIPWPGREQRPVGRLWLGEPR